MGRQTLRPRFVNVEIIDEAPIKTWHLVHGGTVRKEVLLFVAKPLNDEIKRQDDEVERVEWVKISEACKYFDNYYSGVWEEFLSRKVWK